MDTYARNSLLEMHLGLGFRGLKVHIFLCAGPVPEGADAVVQVEDTEAFEENGVKKIRIKKTVSKGHDIRPVVSSSHHCFQFFIQEPDSDRFDSEPKCCLYKYWNFDSRSVWSNLTKLHT